MRELLNKDTTWRKDAAESLDTDTVIKLLTFCLTTTYFVFKGDHYQQKDGCAMGSPCSPLVANAYMEHFEKLALSSASNPPRIWYRYVDDTFCVIKTAFVNEFTDHINSLDNNIKFTREEEDNGTLPFLDTLIVREECGSIKVKVYRKPTHTDQYLHFNSHHPLEHKLSVVRTLTHRAQSVVTDEHDRKEEITHVKNALKNCGYREWTFLRAQSKSKQQTSDTETDTTKKSFSVTLPFVEGVSEKVRRAFNTAGVATTFKPHRTLRQTLVSPKDKTVVEDQSGVVYQLNCQDCDASYISESGRKLGKRLAEHKSSAASSKSAVREHVVRSGGHNIDWTGVKVLERESKDYSRRVLEAIHINTKGPNLNRDKGLDLDPIWDTLLQKRGGAK